MMPGTPNQTLADLTEAYMLGLLKDEQVQTLDRLLRQDHRALDQCAETIEIMSMVHEVCVRREEARELHTHEPLLKDFGQALSESQRMDHDADADAAIQALFELARLHDEGLKQPFNPELHRKAQAQNTIATASKATRLKTKLILTGSLAACIALAGLAVLIVSLFTAPDQPIAAQTDDAIAVATLTAEHDAKWAERALARGSELYAGDTLTLTEGFAEITTHRGAIAILEAPASIEFTHNPNALRLHAGKLVGLCHSESSKGFVVKTDHADITDLGTEFGVEASQPDATEVHVIEGLVEVASPAIELNSPVRLSAQQAVRVDSTKLERVAYTPTGFEADVATAQLRPRFEGRAAQWLGRPPADLTLGQQTSLSLQVFTEQRGLVLDRETAIDFNAEQTWPASGIGKHTVAAGTRVDVYLLHLDTPGERGASFIKGGKYTVHFDRPILGVIGAASSLRATDAFLGAKGVSYPLIDPDAEDPKRETASGIDYPGSWSYPDSAEVVNNGTSLQLKLITSEMMDQVRVLVQAADQ